MELRVTGHVFLDPVPTMDLLVRRRDDEEAAQRGRVFEFVFYSRMRPRVRRGRSHRPVLAEAHDAAVILVPPLCIQHPGVNDMTDGDVQVIGTEVLQQLQGLVPS